MNKNFVEYKIKEERHTFDYFDSIVIWNIFNYIEEMKTNISNLLKYFDTYEKLEKKEIKYVEKSKILTSTFYRSIESEQTFILPEFYFQDELPNEDPYKIAYNLQFSFIDAINESSGLFQPFLLLNSYYMDIICYNGNKGVISAYSISMLPLECIKHYLKRNIRPYFFIIRVGRKDERKYYANVHDFNGVITYNEKKLFIETNFDMINNLDPLPMKQDFAFVLFMENILQNFSYNKEIILSTIESPILYFNHEFKYAYDYNKRILESFICDIPTLIEMKKLKYEMGKYLALKYFIDKDFSELIKIFLETKEKYDNKNKIEIKDDNKKETISEKENDEDKEVVYLNRYDTVIITAPTLEELAIKIKNMKNKKFIRHKYPIPKRGLHTYY